MRKLAVERRNGLGGEFLDGLATTAVRIGWTARHLSVGTPPAPDELAVVWNGRSIRPVGPLLYAEFGWLPRWDFQLSPAGINADSHVAPFVWDGKPLAPADAAMVERRLEEIRQGGWDKPLYMQTGAAGVDDLPAEFLLVPLQVERDTNIQRHVPLRYRQMQAFVDDVGRADPPWPVIFKQHPADHANAQLRLRLLRKQDQVRPHARGNIHQLLKCGRCRGIVSLNSNVVHDGMLWDVPAVVLGRNVWPSTPPSPFLTALPEDWSQLVAHGSEPQAIACRAAYAHHLIKSQWTAADVKDPARVEEILSRLPMLGTPVRRWESPPRQLLPRPVRPRRSLAPRRAALVKGPGAGTAAPGDGSPAMASRPPAEPTAPPRPVAPSAVKAPPRDRGERNDALAAPPSAAAVTSSQPRPPRVNVVAANLGWFCEELQRHFLAASRSDLEVTVSQRPQREAAAWIFLRAEEAATTPDPARTVVQIHDGTVGADRYRPGGERAHVAACGAVVLAQPGQRQLLAAAGVDVAGKLVIERPIGAPAALAARRRLARRFTIANVGRPSSPSAHPWRSGDWFVDVVERLGYGLQVVLIGEGLEHQHRRLLRSRVQCRYFPRSRNGAQHVLRHYHDVDCVVIPPAADPWPLCLFEAMASGVPVVSAPVGWAPQLVRDGETGFLVGSVDEAVQAIERVRAERAAWLARRGAIREAIAGTSLESWVQANLDAALRLAAAA